VAGRQAQRHGDDPEHITNALLLCLLFGVLGARLYHVFSAFSYYVQHPGEILGFQMAGFGIYGAVVGGALGLWIYTRRHKLSFPRWADYAVPGLALAQAIGRWGNFVNQELYGAPTNLPWAITIEPRYRLPGFANLVTYHPLFLYESLFNLANMFFLLWLSRSYGSRLKKGDVFLTYLVSYPVFRFLMEFLRLDASQVAGLNANQTLMAVIAVLAAAALVWRHRPGQSAAVPALATAGGAAAAAGGAEIAVDASEETGEAGESESPDLVSADDMDEGEPDEPAEK
jgi:phosphatidylglycerol:prolipoprotein diacylglycerol transferase